jgi:polysaccharide export outer membrane protein
VIRLQLWREPAWSGDFPVDQFGVAALPLVGDVDIAGMTQSGLKELLRRAFSREIPDPVLQVLVLKRIRVLGEVRAPGVYTLEPTASVADALAMAGGRSTGGRADRVLLRRAGETLTTNVLVDTGLADLAIATGDELSVPERSWASRNAGAVLGATAGLLGLLTTLLIR